MLSDTMTLGPAGADQLIFTKQFPDKDKSQYSVPGLAPNAARFVLVSHQVDTKGARRTLVRLDEIDVNPAPGNTAGTTGTSSLYINIQRQPWKTAAQMESMRVRLKTIVDDSALFAKLLNGEV